MKVFLDTDAFVALHNKDDDHHLEAKTLFQEFAEARSKSTKLYSSDYVLDESITTCYSRTHNRKTAIELGHAVLASKSIVILSVDKSIFEEAWQIFGEKFHDTALSFTDCTTYALIRAHSIQSVFSFDRDFDKLGVNRIPA